MGSDHQRIIGFDFARGIAIVGMIFINFNTVMSIESNWVIEFLSGKAAALFVMLAGIGMSLMYRKAKDSNDIHLKKRVKVTLYKRAGFLFVMGLSYYFIWPADILHYYGIYICVGILLIDQSSRYLLSLSGIIAVFYTVDLLYMNYDAGWDWNTLTYVDFFTINGFFRNLFLNGFHPVFPWVVFLLLGIYLGRLNWNTKRIIFRVMIISVITFVFFNEVSLFFVGLINELPAEIYGELIFLFDTKPIPPSFFYIVTSASLSTFIISLAVWLTNHLKENKLVQYMVSAGQLALTNYFMHVIIGMLGVEIAFGKLENAFSFEFTIAYATVFSLVMIVLSHLWRNYFSRGPIESIMRLVS